MSAEPDTLGLGSVMDAQKDRLNEAIEVLEESKEDLKSDWMKENFDVTIEALKEKRAMH